VLQNARSSKLVIFETLPVNVAEQSENPRLPIDMIEDKSNVSVSEEQP